MSLWSWLLGVEQPRRRRNPSYGTRHVHSGRLITVDRTDARPYAIPSMKIGHWRTGETPRFRTLTEAKRYVDQTERVRANPRGSRRNLDAFLDARGVVHPIRYSADYDPTKAGEKPYSPLRDFDLEGKRIQHAQRKADERRRREAARMGVQQLGELRDAIKADLAEVREARKAASSQKIHRPAWAVGWSDEELSQYAETEGRGRSAYQQDWDAGLRSKETKEFRDLSKRGSAKQQLDARTEKLKAELAGVDEQLRLARAEATAPARRRHNPRKRVQQGGLFGDLGLARPLFGGGGGPKPKRRKARSAGDRIDAFQPDLFGGAGIRRPGFDELDRPASLKQARREMMDSGSPTLFDWLLGR